MPWKMAAVILTIGLNLLFICAFISTSHFKDRFKYGLVFAFFGAFMPVIGFLAGQSAAAWIGQWGFYIGILCLLGLGIYILQGDLRDEDKVARSYQGWAIAAVAISMSLDELAIGFSFGILSFPLWNTLLWMVASAIVLTYVGLVFGAKIRPHMGAWAGKTIGVVLMATSVLLAIEHWFST